MAIPSGIGSEVLKTAAGSVDNGTATLFTVGTDEIITVLSIIVYGTGTTPGAGGSIANFSIKLNNGSTDYIIASESTLTAAQTYVFSEKIVMQPTHVLKIGEANNVTINYWASYILQDWAA